MIILLALMVSSPNHVMAESKYSIFLEKIREIEFKDTYVTDALEFMREKGTEIHKANGVENYILSFEYKFDPTKSGERITFKRKGATYREVLDLIMSQAGLKYEVKKDRVIFLDQV